MSNFLKHSVRLFSTKVKFKILKVKPSERFMIWKSNGKASYIDGPQRKVLINSEYEQLLSHVASQTDYLEIIKKDGNKIIMNGPTQIFNDPTLFSEIKIHKKILFNGTQALIISETSEKIGELKWRELIGPGEYVPQSHEIVQNVPIHTASEQEYLCVHYFDGKIDHIEGPCKLVDNPFKYKKVTKCSLIEVNPEKALLVKIVENEKIKGHIIKGPAKYMPKPNETTEITSIYSVRPTEYIMIKYLSGCIEYKCGPVEIIYNPLEHTSVFKDKLVTVPPEGALFTMEKCLDGKIISKIYNGPYMYTPQPNVEYKLVKKYIVTSDQYAIVTKKSGQIENISGPAELIENPVEIDKIIIENIININTGEAIVVYNNNDNDNKIQRRIINGPTSYIPKSKEWIHQFSWHGASPNDPSLKIRNALIFKKLKLLPNQMFYNIKNVRTRDDTLLTIQLAIFFQLENIEKMLDNTSDVIADFMNGAAADITDFIASVEFSGFKKNISKLNEIETYKRLVERSQYIGYKINKVIFRGYQTTEDLQKMHDNAITIRTKLVLEKETEEQRQDLLTYQIEAEEKRNIKKHIIALNDTKHQIELDKMKSDALLEQKINEHKTELEKIKNINKEEINFLSNLNQNGVELTKYFVSKHQAGPHKWVKIDGENTRVHLHDP